jgi:hypothetical protein
MFFQFKWSFELSFNLGSAGDDGVRKDIQVSDFRNTITPSPVSQRCPQPQRASSTQPQTPPTSSRPKQRRSERFQRTSTHTMVIDPIAETESAKSKDRESLKLLLRATNHTERSTRAAKHNKAMSSGSIDDSLVQSITLEDPFMSYSPLSLPSDSGSDLVSSLQRLRVGDLASYFEDMERTAASRPSRPSRSFATLVHESVEKDEFDSIVKGGDEIKEVEQAEEVEQAQEVEQAKEVEQAEQVEEFEEFEQVEEVEETEQVEQAEQVEEFDEFEQVEDVEDVEEFEEFEQVEDVEDDDWEEMTMSDIIQK